MMKTLKTCKSRLCVILMILVTGILLSCVAGWMLPEGKTLQADQLGRVVQGIQTLCIAVIGIMAGFVAFATSAKDSYWIRRFKSHGLMRNFLFLYIITIVSLILTYIFSLVTLVYPWFLALSTGWLVTALILVGVVMIWAHHIEAQSANPKAE